MKQAAWTRARNGETLARRELIEELHGRYGMTESRAGRSARHLRLWRSRYARLIAVTGSRVLKRGVDLVCCALLLPVLLPLLALVALLIKLTDGGPLLFWQTRVGRDGRLFRFPKFRSMRVGADAEKAALLSRNDHDDSITFKMKKDPRATWIGRIIRKLSIDELPQLRCILRGEMTLVGPRPPVPEEVAKYSQGDRRRLGATPGLTCIWQVSGRGDVAFSKQVEMDMEYVDSQSLWLDIKILLKTIPAVLSGKGAY